MAFLLLLLAPRLHAQDFENYDGNMPTVMNDDGTVIDANGQRRSTWGRDTSKVDKVVPTEFFQWRIDERLGTVTPEEYNDTLPHGFHRMNDTGGYQAEYTFLGNLGGPRLALNVLDREAPSDFMFMQPFSYFHTSPSTLLFTNTKSPLTNLTYHECGTRQNGQDRFRAYFATNINKISGIGFKVDYLYARGYYNQQANSQFGGTLFGYYRGERYEMHAMASWEHMKNGENGGIENDLYITNPQSFPRSYGSRDIPTRLSSVWNRNDQQTYFLTHRYNIGFERELVVPDSLKPKMPSQDELLKRITSDSLRAVIQADTLRLALTVDSLRQAWQAEQPIPIEFVPVTSFVHTFKLKRLLHDNYARNNGIPSDFFSHDPYYRSSYGSFTDETTAFSLKNTFGVQLREGFNKWAQAGITLFATHEHKRFRLPSVETVDTLDRFQRYTENHISVGGEIAKTQGRTVHYRAGAEFWLIGPDAGDVELHGAGDLNFRFLGDTVHLEALASFSRANPTFYLGRYHSQTVWWDNNLNRETRTRLEGTLTLDRTHTSLRFGVENVTNYTHFAMQGNDVRIAQHGSGIQVLSATLRQDLHLGIFHWENRVTWQHSTSDNALPLPTVSLYTNPYIAFIYSKVLRIELGVDMRYHTRYYAPTYAPFIGQFAVQDTDAERVAVGHYPVLDGYVNLAIKRLRAYVSVKHFNQGTGRYFWAPHYPIDPMSIHLGISWNFYD